MTTIASHDVYNWYRSQNRQDLNLPEIKRRDNGHYEIFAGELYCRAPDCWYNRNCGSTNALRKHYKRFHPTLILSSVPQGGRPKSKQITDALMFYQYLYDDFTKRQSCHANANNAHANNAHANNPHMNNLHANNIRANNLPRIPRKRNGMINLTEMRRKVQELGEEHKESCDHFELFESEVRFCKEERSCSHIELYEIDEN